MSVRVSFRRNLELTHKPGKIRYVKNINVKRTCFREYRTYEEMCTAELTEAVNEVYNRRWEKGLIQEFINLLIRMDYVEKKRHGFRVYYTALGSDYKL